MITILFPCYSFCHSTWCCGTVILSHACSSCRPPVPRLCRVWPSSSFYYWCYKYYIMIKPEFVSRYHLTRSRHLASDPITRHFQEGLIFHASHSLNQIRPSKPKPKPKSFHQTTTSFKTKISTKFKPPQSASVNKNLFMKTEGAEQTIPTTNMTLLNLRELLK